MAEYDQAGGGDHGGAPNPGTSNELTPLAAAKNTMVNGAKVLLVGVVGTTLGVLGVVAVTRTHFPGARLVALLVLFFLVVTTVVVVRGLVWLVQGLAAAARAPR